MSEHSDILIVGAGSVGVSVAYYLKLLDPALKVTLIDSHQPLSFTSASSGENFRNWWPHPILKRFFDHSLDLLDALDQQLDARAVVSRKGYLLASREHEPDGLLENLQTTFAAESELREHSKHADYQNALRNAPSGLDIVRSPSVISKLYPSFTDDISSIWHIRRGGTLDAQLIGQHMLRCFRQAGGSFIAAEVQTLQHGSSYQLSAMPTGNGVSAEPVNLHSDIVVNAAGPYAAWLSNQLGLDLPLLNVLQQKVAFEDTAGAIARDLPFCIDLDPALLDWTEEERGLLGDDPRTQRYTQQMPGAIHCRPEGAANGKWVKLGWAFNEAVSEPSRVPELNPVFPEIVVRGASRLQPELATYLDGFPGGLSHYGGHYTMTRENWPLLGQTPEAGYFLATAMSGFGSMAACASGELLSRLILGKSTPDWLPDLGLQRYNNRTLLDEIEELNNRGLL